MVCGNALPWWMWNGPAHESNARFTPKMEPDRAWRWNNIFTSICLEENRLPVPFLAKEK